MRFPDYTPAIVLLALLLAGSLGWDKWHARTASHPPPASKSLASTLEVCSPFNDLRERRMLMFDTESGTAELTEMAGPPTKADETVYLSKRLRKTRVRYSLSESSRTVRVSLGLQPEDYVILMAGDQCILARGPLSGANL